MVLCPESMLVQTPGITKKASATRPSIYLRPWTLSKKMATQEVPFLLDLEKSRQLTIESDEEANVGRGPAIVRNFFIAFVHRAVSLAEKHIAGKQNYNKSNIVIQTAQ